MKQEMEGRFGCLKLSALDINIIKRKLIENDTIWNYNTAKTTVMICCIGRLQN